MFGNLLMLKVSALAPPLSGVSEMSNNLYSVSLLVDVPKVYTNREL
jgi:hypothetical protein